MLLHNNLRQLQHDPVWDQALLEGEVECPLPQLFDESLGLVRASGIGMQGVVDRESHLSFITPDWGPWGWGLVGWVHVSLVHRFYSLSQNRGLPGEIGRGSIPAAIFGREPAG